MSQYQYGADEPFVPPPVGQPNDTAMARLLAQKQQPSLVQQLKQQNPALANPLDMRVKAALEKALIYGIGTGRGIPLSQFGAYGAELRKRFHPEAGPAYPASAIDPSKLSSADMQALMEWKAQQKG